MTSPHPLLASLRAIVGDGALTGGLTFEGLNNAGYGALPLKLILNDNGMSISKNVGALERLLARLAVERLVREAGALLDAGDERVHVGERGVELGRHAGPGRGARRRVRPARRHARTPGGNVPSIRRPPAARTSQPASRRTRRA